jgi:hypothetical protein
MRIRSPNDAKRKKEMIPTTTQIAERLDDLMTHAGAWSRLLRERAGRAGTPEPVTDRLSAAAEEIEGAARSLRWRAEQPDTDPIGMLRVADRSLRHAPLLRDVLERERDAMMTASPDDASWCAHELTALKRVTEARRDLITLTPPGGSPSEELAAIKALAGLLGREIIVDFDSAGGTEPVVDVTLGVTREEMPGGLHLEAAARVARLADRLIRCEIPSWDEAPGASGRIRISDGEDPWLDAVDHAEDWLLERTIDLDTLSEMSWEGEEEASPEP